MDGAGDERPESGWMDEPLETFDRATEALRAAWDATRESRTDALDSALNAVDELTTTFERGIAAALERWAEPGAPQDRAADGRAADDPASDDPAADDP